jgi:hypothetical protein
MKSLKLFLIAILNLLLSNVLLAQKGSPRGSTADIVARAEQVGILHNQSVDYLYQQLYNNASQLQAGRVSTSEKLNFITNVISSEDPGNPLQTILSGAGNSTFRAGLDVFRQNSGTFQSQRGSESLKEINNRSLSLNSQELGFLNELYAIVDANSTNVNALREQLNDYNNRVVSAFGADSKSAAILLSGSMTARYSAEYWIQNTAKWQQLGDILGAPETTTSNRSACCGGIVSADVSGAVGGAVGGAVVGAIAGGVGAGPGAVAGAIGGGVGNSVTQAVTNLIHWLFW